MCYLPHSIISLRYKTKTFIFEKFQKLNEKGTVLKKPEEMNNQQLAMLAIKQLVWKARQHQRMKELKVRNETYFKRQEIEDKKLANDNSNINEDEHLNIYKVRNNLVNLCQFSEEIKSSNNFQKNNNMKIKITGIISFVSSIGWLFFFIIQEIKDPIKGSDLNFGTVMIMIAKMLSLYVGLQALLQFLPCVKVLCELQMCLQMRWHCQCRMS